MSEDTKGHRQGCSWAEAGREAGSLLDAPVSWTSLALSPLGLTSDQDRLASLVAQWVKNPPANQET